MITDPKKHQEALAKLVEELNLRACVLFMISDPDESPTDDIVSGIAAMGIKPNGIRPVVEKLLDTADKQNPTYQGLTKIKRSDDLMN